MGEEDHAGWAAKAKVNGQWKRALIDIGCSKTLLKRLEGARLLESMIIKCVHSDAKEYETALAEIEIGDQKRMLEVGIVPGLGRDMLLGRDWPGVEELPYTVAEACNRELANCVMESEVWDLSRDK